MFCEKVSLSMVICLGLVMLITVSICPQSRAQSQKAQGQAQINPKTLALQNGAIFGDLSIAVAQILRKSGTTTVWLAFRRIDEVWFPREFSLIIADDRANKYSRYFRLSGFGYDVLMDAPPSAKLPVGFTWVSKIEVNVPEIAPIVRIAIKAESRLRTTTIPRHVPDESELDFKKPASPELDFKMEPQHLLTGKELKVRKDISMWFGEPKIVEKMEGDRKLILVTVPIAAQNFDYNPQPIEKFTFYLQLTSGRTIGLKELGELAFQAPKVPSLSKTDFSLSDIKVRTAEEEKARVVLVYSGLQADGYFRFCGFLPIIPAPSISDEVEKPPISPRILTTVAGGEQKNPAIAELITKEAVVLEDENIPAPVTVDGELYLIFALKNRIDPITCGVVPDSGVTKLYVDSKNCPISDPDIAQKIGIIDYVRKLQKNELTLDRLKQETDALTEKRKVLAAIQFGEDSIRILKDFPTTIRLGSLIDKVGWKTAGIFLKKMAELNQELSNNLQKAVDNYIYIMREVRGSRYVIEDYAKAHAVLEQYFMAKSYSRRYSFLYGMIYGRYVEDKGLLAWLSEKTLRIFTHDISEELLAKIIQEDYKKFCEKELDDFNQQLSKRYEATEYTLQLAQSCKSIEAPIESVQKPGEEKLLYSLIEQLKDEDPHLREKAARTLGEIKDPRAVEPLIDALIDGNPIVRSTVLGALTRITGEHFGNDQMIWRKWWERNLNETPKAKSGELPTWVYEPLTHTSTNYSPRYPRRLMSPASEISTASERLVYLIAGHKDRLQIRNRIDQLTFLRTLIITEMKAGLKGELETLRPEVAEDLKNNLVRIVEQTGEIISLAEAPGFQNNLEKIRSIQNQINETSRKIIHILE